MWKRRIGAMTALLISAMVVAAGAASPGAGAAPGAPLFGDVNGDRLIDRVTLGLAPPNGCAVAVELGKAGGGYLVARRYTYPEPGGGALGACPDLGVVVDLGGDGAVELVLAWFDGRPPGYTHDLLVLRNYVPSTGFDAIFQPSGIGLADFNGDSRQDVYEWTDQGEGFATYLNTAAGTLVPGPVKWCSGTPQFVLTDFDRNGAMDVVIAYFEGCGAYFSGVVVVFDTGRVLHLKADVYGESFWTAGVVDANGDGLPDVVTEDEVTGEVTHFINYGYGVIIPAPVANNDVAAVSAVRKTNISVLANDVATTASKLTIVTPPTYGTVAITSSRTIVYAPNMVHAPTDRFVYKLSVDGKSDNAAVSLRYTG